MAFHPYLFFSGNCREAFTRYQEVFGGELFIMTMGEAPGDMPPGADPDLVIHAALTIGDALLMASDDPTGDGGPKVGISVSFNSPDADEITRVFDALAEGGDVSQPLIETFFSPAFGMCVDRFGIPWMFAADQADPA
jgi:PhnB protein